MHKDFLLTKDHERWARSARRKYKMTRKYWEELIKKQHGKCALTGSSLFFDAKNGTPIKGSKGCHPLYAAVDHVNPNRTDHGFQILCYDINDLKSHLPLPLFRSLKKTHAWKKFANDWKKLSETSPKNRHKFKKLISIGSL